jgi:protein SCO1/2
VRLYRQLLLIVAVSLLVVVQSSRLNAQQTGAKRYQLKGTVVSVDVGHSQLTIDMEAIPGYMDAMTMSYRVAGSSVLKTLKKGDRIRATLVVQGQDEHLENITIVPPPQGGSKK